MWPWWLALLACTDSVPLEASWVLTIGSTPVGEVSLYGDGRVVERLGSDAGERRLESRVRDDEVLRAVELLRWLPLQDEGPVAVRWGSRGEPAVGHVHIDEGTRRFDVAGGHWVLEEERLTGQLGPVHWNPGRADALEDVAAQLTRPAPPPPPPGARARWRSPVDLPDAPGQRQQAGAVVVTPVLWAEVADTPWQGRASGVWELEPQASVRRTLRDLLTRISTVQWSIDPLPASPALTWEKRRGGCLAQAQLFAAWAEDLGLVTRVVTGLRWQEADEGGELAWHAWVEVDTGEPAGWVGIDPSGSRSLVDGRYLRVGEHHPDRAEQLLEWMSSDGWGVEAVP